MQRPRSLSRPRSSLPFGWCGLVPVVPGVAPPGVAPPAVTTPWPSERVPPPGRFEKNTKLPPKRQTGRPAGRQARKQASRPANRLTDKQIDQRPITADTQASRQMYADTTGQRLHHCTPPAQPRLSTPCYRLCPDSTTTPAIASPTLPAPGCQGSERVRSSHQ